MNEVLDHQKQVSIKPESFEIRKDLIIIIIVHKDMLEIASSCN